MSYCAAVNNDFLNKQVKWVYDDTVEICKSNEIWIELEVGAEPPITLKYKSGKILAEVAYSAIRITYHPQKFEFEPSWFGASLEINGGFRILKGEGNIISLLLENDMAKALAEEFLGWSII